MQRATGEGGEHKLPRLLAAHRVQLHQLQRLPELRIGVLLKGVEIAPNRATAQKQACTHEGRGPVGRAAVQGLLFTSGSRAHLNSTGSCGITLILLRSTASGSREDGMPSRRISPSVGAMRKSAASRLDFPAPVRPTIPQRVLHAPKRAEPPARGERHSMRGANPKASKEQGGGSVCLQIAARAHPCGMVQLMSSSRRASPAA